MAKKLPAWLEGIQQNWRQALIVALTLALIWGIAAFVWGSLAAWAKHKATQQLEFAMDAATPAVTEWLTAPFAPLKAQLADPVLQTLPTLPLGLASPAAQRWLDSQATNPALAEAFMADFETGRTVVLPGSTPPPPEVLGRMGVLQQSRRNSPLIVASGRSNAMLYMAQPLPGAKQGMLILPQSLRQLAPRAPVLETPMAISIGVLLPHASGGIALWQAAEPMRLELKPNLPQSPEVLKVQQALRGFPEVKLEAIWQGALPGPNPLVYFLVFFWAVLMSMVVIWPHTSGVRHTLGQRMAPLINPIGALTRRYTEGPLAKLAQLVQTLQHKIGQAFRGLFQTFKRLTPALRKKDPESWRKAGIDEGNTKPTEGPGSFMPADFTSAAAREAAIKPTAKFNLRPLNTELSKPGYPASELSRAASRPEDDVLFREEKASMQSRVLNCLNAGKLDLLYQPIYRASDGTVFANEVLARLADTEGTITPGQFLPILASAGKLAELDALVFERIIGVHCGNGRMPATKLSINISGNSLEDLDYLREVAQQGQSVLQHIIFEVRSNEVVRDPNALKLLKALQRQGGKVAIDYFGGGAGMVRATKALDLDFIKADAMRMIDKASKRDLLEMCLMAAERDLPVVMEKIEDKRNEDFARQASVKFLQGYGLGKPTPTLITLPLSAKMSS